MNQCIITTTCSTMAAFAVVILMISISLRVRMCVLTILCDNMESFHGSIASMRRFSINAARMLLGGGSDRARGLFLVGIVFVMFVTACITLAVVPYTEIITCNGGSFSICSMRTSVGLIYIMAIFPLLAYLPRLADLIARDDQPPSIGDDLNNLLAAELSILLAAISLFMVAGSLNLQQIVAGQGALPWTWNVARQPIAFILFAALFLLRMGRWAAGKRHPLSLFTDHLHLLAASTILVVLFLGGWQIPFINSENIVAHAIPIIVIGWPLAGVICAAIGAWKLLCIRGGQIFGRKSLIAGLPPLIVGAALFGAFIAFGDWALPLWASGIMLAVLQLLAITIKTLLIYSAIVYVRCRLPAKYWDGILNYTWPVILPTAAINLLITAGIVYFVK